MIDKRIEAIDVDDGRKIVMLCAGWCYGDDNRPDDDACHTFGADTNAEIRSEMRRVRPCSCRDCREALGGNGRLWDA